MQPMAGIDPSEDAVPVVDMGRQGPPRCANCNAYVNPFVRWIDAGKRFVCNICGAVNDTPAPYFCALDESGRRTGESGPRSLALLVVLVPTM